MRILVVNAGSSSLKLRALETDDRVARSADLPAARGRFEESELVRALEDFGPVDVVAHRIVHGGTEFTRAVVVDGDVEARLHALAELAPLHQAASLAALEAVRRVRPETRAVACFDTAFHATLPAAAATYALPAEWRSRWGLRRFGFHGLSHAYAARRASEMVAGGRDELRVVTCHLGAGASLAAVVAGRSRDTTMGFTPLEGLVMATRSGSVDPGLLLWLVEHAGISPAELAETLEESSGLVGLAGTADMRELLARADRGDADAGLALDVYVHRLRSGVAAMAAAMNGLDALVFTGGVGENAAAIRERAIAGLGFLGAGVEVARNETGRDDRDVSAEGAPVHTLVVAAREDLEMARQVRKLLGGNRGHPTPD